jgi:hypothetical protein
MGLGVALFMGFMVSTYLGDHFWHSLLLRHKYRATSRATHPEPLLLTSASSTPALPTIIVLLRVTPGSVQATAMAETPSGRSGPTEIYSHLSREGGELAQAVSADLLAILAAEAGAIAGAGGLLPPVTFATSTRAGCSLRQRLLLLLLRLLKHDREASE